MDISKYKSWTSTDWEEQFKKDDRSISTYFSELSKYIDLPEEEEIILGAMVKNNLIPENYASLELLESDAIGFIENHSAHKSLNSPVFKELVEVSENIVKALSFSNTIKKEIGLKLLFSIGRVASLHLDAIEIDGNDYSELKKAILKRQLYILNDIIGIIVSDIADESTRNVIIDKLYEIRGKLTEVRFQIV